MDRTGADTGPSLCQNDSENVGAEDQSNFLFHDSPEDQSSFLFYDSLRNKILDLVLRVSFLTPPSRGD